MSSPVFEVFKSLADNQFYYHLRAGNSRIVLGGEGYTSKQSCLEGIKAVKKNARFLKRFSSTNQPGNFNFVLTAVNGEIIGRSESYATKAGREKGIMSVRESAARAQVEDLTGLDSFSEN